VTRSNESRTGRNGRERLESGNWTAEGAERGERGGDNHGGTETSGRLGLVAKGLRVRGLGVGIWDSGNGERGKQLSAISCQSSRVRFRSAAANV